MIPALSLLNRALIYQGYQNTTTALLERTPPIPPIASVTEMQTRPKVTSLSLNVYVCIGCWVLIFFENFTVMNFIFLCCRCFLKLQLLSFWQPVSFVVSKWTSFSIYLHVIYLRSRSVDYWVWRGSHGWLLVTIVVF